MTSPENSGRARLSEWAARHDLEHVGNGRGALNALIEIRPEFDIAVRRHSIVGEHVATFGASRRQRNEPTAVAALAFPYEEDTDALRDDARAFAEQFGLAHRVKHPDDRVWNADRYTAIAFWRHDFFDLD